MASESRGLLIPRTSNQDLFYAATLAENIFLALIPEFLLGKEILVDTCGTADDIVDKELVSTSFSPGARD